MKLVGFRNPLRSLSPRNLKRIARWCPKNNGMGRGQTPSNSVCAALNGFFILGDLSSSSLYSSQNLLLLLLGQQTLAAVYVLKG